MDDRSLSVVLHLEGSIYPHINDDIGLVIIYRYSMDRVRIKLIHYEDISISLRGTDRELTYLVRVGFGFQICNGEGCTLLDYDIIVVIDS